MDAPQATLPPDLSADLPAPLAERIAKLAPDQRAAATAPPGPVLCIAPAGSGKTTTLVARIAWLIGGPVRAEPATVMAITFNKRAQEEMAARLGPALEPLGVDAAAVRVRTFHALGREILLDAGAAVEPLVERAILLAELLPEASPAERRRLDTAFSRLKLDLRVTPEEIRACAEVGPVAAAFLAYEETVAESGGLDFDDLIARALTALEADPALLARWRARCGHLLVDEVQDVDRSQLTLALLLAAPSDRIFLVGDDDQSIYGWRLADVRRVVGLADALHGLRRVDLEVNYRCPAPVLERAVRLIEHNGERFAKRIRAGPTAVGRLILAPDGGEDAERIAAVLGAWPDDDGSRAFLARTNRELIPVAAVALERGLAFRAPALALPIEEAAVEELLATLETDPGADPLDALGRLRAAPSTIPDELLSAAIAWAAPFPTSEAFIGAVRERRERLARLRSDEAPLTLATAHATKGLEFDHVAVIGLDAGRFPSARALAEAPEPERALEEERRLAYVAWTRARRSLTLVYDPAAPSPFLLEAFEPEELGLDHDADEATMGR
jgi:DNA helicase-2/ATP-dependent DNA helicase PcrA